MADSARIPVAVPGAPYDVVIGDGLLGEVGELVRAVSGAHRAVLITDESVAALYGEKVRNSLVSAEFDCVEITVAAGEPSKSWASAGDVLERMAAARLGRGDLLVALGGGVIGDLGGFCAATYLRGIDFVQVPTTLLAQVDSSVGGKTGVDLAAGKNLAGAFKQPRVVVADTAALATLPDIEWQSGLAEVAKVAMLAGPEQFEWMTARAADLAAREPRAVRSAVEISVSHKVGVVVADEREAGVRESLNYGHTLGHAIEHVAGYGSVAHGVAVAEGMRFAARIAQRMLSAPETTAKRQDVLLDSLGIARAVYPRSAEALLRAMHSDKKARDGVVRFVLVAEPGVCLVAPVSDEMVAEELGVWLRSVPERG